MVQEFKEIYNIHIIIHKGNFPLNPFVNAYKIGQIIRSNQFALTTALNGNSFREC